MAVEVLFLISYILAIILVSCFGCLLCFAAYIHYIHKITEHIPGPPRSSFIFGHIPEIRKYKAETGRPMCELMLIKRQEYGPVFIVYFMHRPVVYLGDSNMVRHVFINNHKSLRKDSFLYHKLGIIYGVRGAGFGLAINTDEISWRHRRRIMNPAFHRKCLRDYMSNFNNVSDQFLVRMDTVFNSGKPTSMLYEFAKVTLEAISQVSFNINTHVIEKPDSPFPTAIRNYGKGVKDNMEIPLSPTFLGIFQFSLLQNSTKREQINAVKFLRNFAFECITTRTKEITDNKNVPDDLLSILIKDGSLSIDEIADEFLTIFIAGQETTANTLAFTLYEIIKHPDVEAKLLNEINEVLGDRDNVEFDDLAKLKYLGQVFEESYRKHPVIIAPSRFLTKGLNIGGYYIPKGVGVASSPLFFGMNPEIWKDPEVFDPDRFADVTSFPNYSMTHFPFSIGPRNCIGQTFARFESKVVLAKLLRKFQFKLLPGQTDRIAVGLTLYPRDGVMCDVSRRE